MTGDLHRVETASAGQRNSRPPVARSVNLPGPSSSASQRTRLIGGVITIAVTLGYFLLFWNRFAGIRSGVGGCDGGGMAVLQGLLPYRDIFTAAPPLLPSPPPRRSNCLAAQW